MRDSRKKFKPTPKKFHPSGLTILHEDHDIIVVDKTHGLLTVSSEKVKENTAFYKLNNYVRKGVQKSKNRVFIVHRLDRDTSGVLVFAKSEQAKRFLQDEWQNFSKTYYTVVRGKLELKEDTISSYLAENKMHKVYSVDDPTKGKLAKTAYTVVKESQQCSLLKIDLLTGRKNQIRVHFAEKNHPVVGDTRYGKNEKGVKRLALHAASLTIVHPYTKEKMTFETKIPDFFNSLVRS